MLRSCEAHLTFEPILRSGVEQSFPTGRIVNPAGRALPVPLRKDSNLDIVATVAFATGQLEDPDAVAGWRRC